MIVSCMNLDDFLIIHQRTNGFYSNGDNRAGGSNTITKLTVRVAAPNIDFSVRS